MKAPQIQDNYQAAHPLAPEQAEPNPRPKLAILTKLPSLLRSKWQMKPRKSKMAPKAPHPLAPEQARIAGNLQANMTVTPK